MNHPHDFLYFFNFSLSLIVMPKSAIDGKIKTRKAVKQTVRLLLQKIIAKSGDTDGEIFIIAEKPFL